MRRATDTTLENHLNRIISIHALHEESDPLYGANALLPAISIHALHEESDPLYGANALLPAISIHALHEENDGDAVEDRADLRISIHALHEESDTIKRCTPLRLSGFQSTLSMRRATQAYSLLSVWDGFQSTLCMRRATGGDFTRPLTSTISIHALHEESDCHCPKD